MKINTINNSYRNLNNNNQKTNAPSFKRAFEATVNSLPYCFEYKTSKNSPRLRTPLNDVVDILRKKPVKQYDDKTAKKIARFLKSEITDTKPEQGGIFSRIVCGKFLIFTGEEAKRAREIVEKAKQEYQEVEQKYLSEPSDDMEPSERISLLYPETFHKIDSQNVGIRRDKALLEMVEDGDGGKPYTTFNIEVDGDRIKEIDYRYFHAKRLPGEGLKFDSKKVSKTLRV